MDLSTIIGLGSGILLFVISIRMGGPLGSFYSASSIVIVLGGTISATIVSYPMNQIKQLFKTVKKTMSKTNFSSSEIINNMVSFSEKARREGLLSLEDEIANLDDSFMQKGVQLVVDGTDPDLVRNILETELSFLEDRHAQGRGIFSTMGSYAPAFGMAGTLIGLIRMLETLDNPETIGPGLAVALLTTFYGTILSNLFFNPMAAKLKVKSSEEILLKEVVIEGLLSIQAGENPRIVEEKLKAFLAPNERESFNKNTEVNENEAA
ncbi:motility protein A [Alkalicella caledoniensis]|uniref:Motility protein A n=1 Tax=Alkalicella caledoniensis TaxID=2731377 RepID=A0A7G9WDI5_ALKCA|nr:motility protein A [Alkalicella caledoniensis]QNO16747.1 motility protein A [Alkalicella caledoniensis]